MDNIPHRLGSQNLETHNVTEEQMLETLQTVSMVSRCGKHYFRDSGFGKAIRAYTLHEVTMYEVTSKWVVPISWDAKQARSIITILEYFINKMATPRGAIHFAVKVCSSVQKGCRSVCEMKGEPLLQVSEGESIEEQVFSQIRRWGLQPSGWCSDNSQRLIQHHASLAAVARSGSKCNACVLLEEQLGVMKQDNTKLKEQMLKTGKLNHENECLKQENKYLKENFNMTAQRQDAAIALLERQLDTMHKAYKQLSSEKETVQCQLATMSERCDQAQKEAEALRVEATRLRGEKDDLISMLLPSKMEASGVKGIPKPYNPRHQESSRVQSEDAWDVTSESRSWINIPSDGSGNESASAISVCTSEGYCFKSDAVFKTVSEAGMELVFASELRKGTTVLAADGNTHITVAAAPQPYKTNRIVELSTGVASLQVTRDHRVPMLDNIQSEQRVARAIELLPGNFVFVDNQATELLGVKEQVLQHEVEVCKIVFAPDLPVGVFAMPMTIASHGSKKKPLRRGGTKAASASTSEGYMPGQASTAARNDCED
eukprot:TRINITY_DN40900_c0_g1_i1.p1 TRINITY_DN40900_c0_g1~~TRINITY_DN40900_c0_g1_i1.p1  ORF type:complete len:544 (-),score=90.87 TRINITY_DN40900_c0_g1_i1:63-1694(-)